MAAPPQRNTRTRTLLVGGFQNQPCTRSVIRPGVACTATAKVAQRRLCVYHVSQRIIRNADGTPIARHTGRQSTLEQLPGAATANHAKGCAARCRVGNCHVCKRSKPRRYPPHCTLLPLPADRPWQDISMDFSVRLPESRGFDAKGRRSYSSIMFSSGMACRTPF